MPYIIAICLLLGFSTGYYTESQFNKAERVDEITRVLKKQKDEMDISHAADIKFITEKKQQEVVAEVITKEVVKYVTKIQKVDSDCNLSSGSERLLNDSRLQSNPAESTPTDSGASKIREIDLITYTHKITDMYNAARLQCNSLIAIENTPLED